MDMLIFDPCSNSKCFINICMVIKINAETASPVKCVWWAHVCMLKLTLNQNVVKEVGNNTRDVNSGEIAGYAFSWFSFNLFFLADLKEMVLNDSSPSHIFVLEKYCEILVLKIRKTKK